MIMIMIMIMVLVIVMMAVITCVVAVVMVHMTMRVIIMIMLMISKEVEMMVPGVAAKSLLQHPKTNDQYEYGGKKSEPGVKFRFRIRSGKEPGDYAQQNDAECVGNGNNQAEQHAVNRPPPGADHIGRYQGFPVSWFKRVQGPQYHSPKVEH